MNSEYIKLLENYTNWLKQEGYTAGGITHKIRGARYYLQYMQIQDMDIYCVTEKEAENYRTYLLQLVDENGNRYYSIATIQKQVNFVRLLYRYLISKDHMEYNPFLNTGRKKERQIREFTEKNVHLLRQYTNWLQSNGYTVRGIEEKIRIASDYILYVESQNRDIYRATVEMAEKYKKYIQCLVDSDGTVYYSRTTINTQLCCLRLFYRYLLSVDLAYHNPFDNTDRQEFITNSEYLKLIDEYTDWLHLKGFKPRGIEEKIRAVYSYILYTQKQDIGLYYITRQEAEDYREHLRLMTDDSGKVRYNPKTINVHLTLLRLFYRYLLTIEKVYRNPFSDVDSLKERKSLPKNILTIDQMEAVLQSIPIETIDDVRFKVVTELLYASGLRISEVDAIRYDDVDTETGYIVIKDDKARQDRRVPVTEYCCSLLKLYMKYRDSNGYLFRQGKKRALNSWINHRLKRLARSLDFPPVTSHSIRHSLATHLLKKGADLREVQEILGHRNIKNTEIYTRIFPEDLKDVVEHTHPREMRRV